MPHSPAPTDYAKPRPKITALNAPYWSYARQHELRFLRCLDCSRWIYPISPFCQHCWSERHEWAPASGKGRVVSWVTYHKAFEESFREDLPYTVIHVEVKEGFRLTSNFIDRDTQPEFGMKVKVAFDDVDPELTLVKFAPDNDGVKDV